jgi:hypothetical protein
VQRRRRTWAQESDNPYGRYIMALNEEKLHQFLGRFVSDLGATTG